jgi:hypothetical protein
MPNKRMFSLGRDNTSCPVGGVALPGRFAMPTAFPFTSNNVHGRYTETPARAPRPLAREPDGEPRAFHECCMGRAVGLLGNLERRERAPGPQPPGAGRARHTV